MFTCGQQLKFRKILAHAVKCFGVDYGRNRWGPKWYVFVSVFVYLLWFACKYFYVEVCDRKEHALSLITTQNGRRQTKGLVTLAARRGLQFGAPAPDKACRCAVT